MLSGQVLKIHKARAAKVASAAVPGSVIDCCPNPVVSTGGGGLEILEFQMQGKKRMSACEFLRGCPLPSGTLLGE